MSVYGGNIGKDLNKENKCATETWMKENFDNMVKEWFPLKNGNLILNLEDGKRPHDYDKAKSIITTPSHYGSYISSQSNRLMNEALKLIGGFHNNSILYGYTEGMYIHKKYWSDLLITDLLVKRLTWLKMIMVFRVYSMPGL